MNSRPFVEVTQWTPPSEPVRVCTGEPQDHKVDPVVARKWEKLAQTNQRMRRQLRGAAERELSLAPDYRFAFPKINETRNAQGPLNFPHTRQIARRLTYLRSIVSE